ncbi:MAG: RNAase [Synechococcaceae cyanobacterium SM2_3_1]|nr:RNAase [Synechococcaceae cyanobacterium SM2_3_1]
MPPQHPPIPEISAEQLRRLSPAAFAYIGDALYELHCRQIYLYPPLRQETYHRRVVERVKGTAQAALLDRLSPHLLPEEQAIVNWGRNGCGKAPRHLSAQVYRHASGLETLLGYLHLTDPERLHCLLNLCDQLVLENSDSIPSDPA